MVSGYPLHPEEEKYIREHREDFPSITARALGNYFAHLNGGSRTTQTVRDYLKKLEDEEKKKVETPHTRIPGATLSTGPLVTLCVEPDPPPEKMKETKKKKASTQTTKKKEPLKDACTAQPSG